MSPRHSAHRSSLFGWAAEEQGTTTTNSRTTSTSSRSTTHQTMMNINDRPRRRRLMTYQRKAVFAVVVTSLPEAVFPRNPPPFVVDEESEFSPEADVDMFQDHQHQEVHSSHDELLKTSFLDGGGGGVGGTGIGGRPFERFEFFGEDAAMLLSDEKGSTSSYPSNRRPAPTPTPAAAFSQVKPEKPMFLEDEDFALAGGINNQTLGAGEADERDAGFLQEQLMDEEDTPTDAELQKKSQGQNFRILVQKVYGLPTSRVMSSQLFRFRRIAEAICGMPEQDREVGAPDVVVLLEMNAVYQKSNPSQNDALYEDINNELRIRLFMCGYKYQLYDVDLQCNQMDMSYIPGIAAEDGRRDLCNQYKFGNKARTKQSHRRLDYDRRSGIAIFSKLKFIQTEIYQFGDKDGYKLPRYGDHNVENYGTLAARGIRYVSVKVEDPTAGNDAQRSMGGQVYHIFATQLTPDPSVVNGTNNGTNTTGYRQRRKELEEVRDLITSKNIDLKDYVILAGDFNLDFYGPEKDTVAHHLMSPMQKSKYWVPPEFFPPGSDDLYPGTGAQNTAFFTVRAGTSSQHLNYLAKVSEQPTANFYQKQDPRERFMDHILPLCRTKMAVVEMNRDVAKSAGFDQWDCMNIYQIRYQRVRLKSNRTYNMMEWRRPYRGKHSYYVPWPAGQQLLDTHTNFDDLTDHDGLLAIIWPKIFPTSVVVHWQETKLESGYFFALFNPKHEKKPATVDANSYTIPAFRGQFNAPINNFCKDSAVAKCYDGKSECLEDLQRVPDRYAEILGNREMTEQHCWDFCSQFLDATACEFGQREGGEPDAHAAGGGGGLLDSCCGGSNAADDAAAGAAAAQAKAQKQGSAWFHCKAFHVPFHKLDTGQRFHRAVDWDGMKGKCRQMIWIRNYEDGWKSKAKVGHRNRVAVHWPKEYKHFYSKKYSTRIEKRGSNGHCEHKPGHGSKKADDGHVSQYSVDRKLSHHACRDWCTNLPGGLACEWRAYKLKDKDHECLVFTGYNQHNYMPKQGQKSADGGSAECDDCKFQGGNSSRCADELDILSETAQRWGHVMWWGPSLIANGFVGAVNAAGAAAKWVGTWYGQHWGWNWNVGDVQHNVEHAGATELHNCTRTCWNMWEEVDED